MTNLEENQMLRQGKKNDKDIHLPWMNRLDKMRFECSSTYEQMPDYLTVKYLFACMLFSSVNLIYSYYV